MRAASTVYLLTFKRGLPGLLLLIGLGAATAQSPEPASSVATYNHGVASVLQEHCIRCHSPTGGAPFSLLTYADAKQWGDQILNVTQSRYMPPWLPVPDAHSPIHAFKGERRLSDADMGSIRAWVSAGLPEGVREPLMQPSADSTIQWKRLDIPDRKLTLSQAIHVPASGPDIFLTFALPAHATTAHAVRALAIETSEPKAVRSIFVGIDERAQLRKLHPEVAASGLAGVELSAQQTQAFAPGGQLLLWTPDAPVLSAADAWELPPGSDLVLTVHIKTTGKEEDLVLSVLLYFAKAGRQAPLALLHLDRDDDLEIAAGEKQFKVEGQMTLKQPTRLASVYPRAHYAARSMEAYAMLPDGSRRALLSIDKWDADWASVYRFAEPVALPKGAVIHMSYVYDNSSSNPHNPGDPPKKIVGGHGAKDEVAELWMETAR